MKTVLCSLFVLCSLVRAEDLPPIAGEWKAPIPGMRGFYAKHVFTSTTWTITQGEDTWSVPIKFLGFKPGPKPRISFFVQDKLNPPGREYRYFFDNGKLIPEIDSPRDALSFTRVSFDEVEAQKILQNIKDAPRKSYEQTKNYAEKLRLQLKAERDPDQREMLERGLADTEAYLEKLRKQHGFKD